METQDILDWADPSTEIQSTFSPVQWYEVFPVTNTMNNYHSYTHGMYMQNEDDSYIINMYTTGTSDSHT